ncbi:carbohydrate ABC transporter permease [Ruminococcus sp.]|jgi:multiple sugar transport system permease protein|uniref:carbohydrate ABC transporter permease n=2 Tax=Ruminococcus sp. TaxID=41978 RepID=UPI001B282E75|nr:carbohydrate ABC transporter permease [Ruminococcus sp.]MBE6874505.1 carbohydrate ABC transporter permease [Ruminococcus albus]MBO5558818.1 carbohydrate ABC transporter permease [Ruminococcus sp.]MBR0528847.1 carbohydrate ABC transporter permease [Ruminococcus sp.]
MMNSEAQKKPVYISQIVIKILSYAVLICGCLMVLIPIVVILLGAFKDSKEFANSGVFEMPKSFAFDNFKTAFFEGKVMRGLFNTFIIIVISCFGTILTGTMTAFIIQRFDSKMTRLIKGAFLLATLLPNISMQVTVFQIISKMGLYNTMAAPIILYVGTDIISIYIFMQFLSQIPVSLDESGIMDGASYPRIYFSIILPNLKPAVATVLIIKFVSIYNDFYTPQLYMQDESLLVVSTVLYKYISSTKIQWEVVFSGIILCIIPTLLIFLFLQKYIYSGLVSGAVKE